MNNTEETTTEVDEQEAYDSECEDEDSESATAKKMVALGIL